METISNTYYPFTNCWAYDCDSLFSLTLLLPAAVFPIPFASFELRFTNCCAYPAPLAL